MRGTRWHTSRSCGCIATTWSYLPFPQFLPFDTNNWYYWEAELCSFFSKYLLQIFEKANLFTWSGNTKFGWKVRWQCCYLPLAVADNIRSLLSCYTTPHRILNRKFCFNYIVLAACDITEGLDNCVASKLPCLQVFLQVHNYVSVRSAKHYPFH